MGVGDGDGEGVRVIVVGGGLAGLAAALAASHGGARVTLFEMEKNVGGNSAKASSGINGVCTDGQRKAGVADSAGLFVGDTQRAGQDGCDAALVRTLAAQSADGIAWLESFGIDLSSVCRLGGHSTARTHHEPPRADGRPTPVGYDIVSALKRRLAQDGNVAIRTGTEVTRLLVEQGENGHSIGDALRVAAASATSVVGGAAGAAPSPRAPGVLPELLGPTIAVKGVAYVAADGQGELEMTADAVILATGGYANDRQADSFLRLYAPQWARLPTTNGAFARGIGVRLAVAVGAATRDLDKVQIHPTGFVDPADPCSSTKILAPESLRGHGGILVDGRGQRFVDELSTRDAVSGAILERGVPLDEWASAAGHRAPGPPSWSPDARAPRLAYLLLSGKALADFGVANAAFYQQRGLIKRHDSAAEAAAALGLEAATLAATLEAYAASASRGQDEFGKTCFPCALAAEEPCYAAIVTPAIHYTMGGLCISSAAEVLHRSGDRLRPILRLLGAGEVTGGVHGAQRLGGNSLAECVVFGRIAGERAAAIALTSAPALSKDAWRSLVFRESIALGDSRTHVFRFDLPSPLHTTGMRVGEYVSVRAMCPTSPEPGSGVEEVLRFYSPISRPWDLGRIELLVKVDPDHGQMSQFLAKLVPDGKHTLDFKGPVGGPQVQDEVRSGRIRRIGMIAGGVGISPMLQIVRAVFYIEEQLVRNGQLEHGGGGGGGGGLLAPGANEWDLSLPLQAGNVPKLKLIYAAENEAELVFKDDLERKARERDCLDVYFALHHPPQGWTGETGFVTRDMIQHLLWPPADDLMVVLCGPMAMCRALKPVLSDLGYRFYSFM